MARRLDVLLVSDDEAVFAPLAELLRERHEVRLANSLRRAIEELVHRVPDAVVCDHDLSPYCGDALLAMIAREHPHVRRVLYTGPRGYDNRFAGAAHVALPRQATSMQLLAAIAGDD
jgi:DNA-binding NtrC family response regulator